MTNHQKAIARVVIDTHLSRIDRLINEIDCESFDHITNREMRKAFDICIGILRRESARYTVMYHEYESEVG